MAETNLNKYLRPELERLGERTVRDLKRSLIALDHVDTETLLRSIRHKVVIRSNSDFEIQLFWNTNSNSPRGVNYGDLLNKGNQNGWLSKAGQKRLIAWVKRKLPLTTRAGRKRPDSPEEVAFLIQRSWAKGNKYPSQGEEWADRVLDDAESAESKRILGAALARAYQNYLDEVIKNTKQKR